MCSVFIARTEVPLARPCVFAGQTTRNPRAVLPPINGGLHCGGNEVTGIEGYKGVLPPINGGLHCGDPFASVPTATCRCPLCHDQVRHQGQQLLVELEG